MKTVTRELEKPWNALYPVMLVGQLFLHSGCEQSPLVDGVADLSQPASKTSDLASSPRDLAAVPDLGIRVTDLGIRVTDFAELTACTASNYLDHDSSDVVSAALADCLATPSATTASTCVRSSDGGADNLELVGLDQGVGSILFRYTVKSDGTEELICYGQGGDVPSPPGVLFQSSGIPPGTSMETALERFFESTTQLAFPCTWT